MQFLPYLKLNFWLICLTNILFSNGYKFDTESQPPYKIFLCSLTGSRSHVRGLFEIGAQLVADGHELTFLSTPNRQAWGKNYNFSFRPVGKDEIKPLFQRLQEAKETIFKGREFSSDEFLVYDLDNTFINPFKYSFEPILKEIDEGNPDLMICDFGSIACLDAATLRNVPLIIGFQSIDFGAILETSYYTNQLKYHSLSSLDLTFYQRFFEYFYLPISKKLGYIPLVGKVRKMKEGFGLKFTPKVIRGNLDKGLILSTSFYGFELPRPTPPNIQLVGPILPQGYGVLEDDVKKFINTKKRVAFVSFGTNVGLDTKLIEGLLTSLVLCIRQNILDGVVWSLTQTNLNLFPESIIINTETLILDQLFIQYNIKTVSWVNQLSLLSQSNVQLFISHGGLESIFEAMYTQTPMLIIPLYYDQPLNAKKVELLGLSKTILPDQFYPPQALDIINSLLTNEEIETNFKRIKSLMGNPKANTKLAASKIVSYIQLAKACRTLPNSKDLPCEILPFTPHSKLMPAIKAYNVDIWLTLLTLFISFSYLFLKGIHFLLYYLFKKKDKTD